MVFLPRWQVFLILGLTLLACLYAAPNFYGRETRAWAETHLPSWLPSKAVTLGLDLQGGSHLLLEVDTEAAYRDRLNSLLEQIRVEMRATSLRRDELARVGDGVRLSLVDPSDRSVAREKLAKLDTGVVIKEEGDRSLVFTYDERAQRDIRSGVVNQSIEIVRRRIDETGTKEPSIQRQGENRIVVQLPGIDNPERIKSLLGKTAKLTFRFVDPDTPVTDNPSLITGGDREVLPSADKDGAYYVVSRRVMVSGENLVDAQPNFQQGLPVVAFRFDSLGSKRFGDATREGVGKLFAIVLDGKVISAPVIREPILGGSGVISGHFTAESATDLAVLLRAGALPAPINVIEERTVGPGLGADSVAAGRISAVLGFAAVALAMLLFYGFFGLFAVVALIFNLLMIFALLSIFGATLTLPGIAGIILTIGTAVDANVLIFERMKEELRFGRSAISAMDAGYSRALSAITDANITTLIAALLMFVLGSGPIRGFAVTLSIGTITSVFSAVMLTRLFIVWWFRSAKPKALPL